MPFDNQIGILCTALLRAIQVFAFEQCLVASTINRPYDARGVYQLRCASSPSEPNKPAGSESSAHVGKFRKISHATHFSKRLTEPGGV
jgi:hypothetical protein